MLLLLIVIFCGFVGCSEANHGSHCKIFAGEAQCSGTSCLTKRSAPAMAKRATNDLPSKDVPMPQDCNRVLVGNSGELTSPNWPRKKVDFLQCRVSIFLEPSWRALLNFDQFELEGTESCSEEQKEKNYVMIHDVVSGRKEKICGSKSNFTWTANSNEVLVDFVAFSASVFHRFRASYSAINSEPPTECSAVLTSKVGRYTSSSIETLTELAITQSVVQCEVLFHAPAGDRVLLTFTTLTSPCATPVEIRDVLTGRAADVCGDMSHFSWVSDGNEVVMTYSEETINPAAVEIILEHGTIEPPPAASRDCSSTLSPIDGLGELSSPLYPNPYPNNLDCEIYITVDPSLVVVITFDVFLLENAMRVEGETRQKFGALPVLHAIVDTDLQEEECVYDYVQIEDMTTDRVDRICGVRHPFSWTSDSNEVVILFHTDDVLSFTGFTARFYPQERLPDPDCVSMVASTGTAAYLTSVLYPLPYPSNLDCSLQIHQDPDQFVTLDFLNFDLEISDGCENDVFRIKDITSKRSESFCGKLPSFTWSSDSNEVMITFKSDNLIQTKGFSVIGAATILPSRTLIESDCRNILVEPTGDIKLPSHTEWPPLGGRDCFILIHGTPYDRILLRVTEFSIEEAENYQREEKDFVSIQDISPTSGGRNNYFYGQQQTPFLWTSQRNEIIVYIRQSTAFLASVRLQASYRMFTRTDSGCSFSYSNPSGDINWVMSPTYVENTTYCDMTIHADPDKQIVVNFEELRLDGDECQDHSLTINDYGAGKSEQFCSSHSAFSWLSEYNELYFKMHHSGSIVFYNIKASYYFIDRSTDLELHQFFSKPEGSFSTLEHIREEAVPGNCSVTIQASADRAVVVRFFDFLVGDEQADTIQKEPVFTHPKFSCDEEFVELLDINTGRRDTYCGKFNTFSWTSDANVVRVTFAVNSAAMYHGFRANYVTIEKLTDMSSQFLTSKLGSLQSQNFPSNYPTNTKQHWVIHAEPGYALSLRFTTFALESSLDCQKDFVEIHDLTTDRKTTLCGTYGLFVQTSEGNEMKVTLVSDESITNIGIDVIYEQVPKPTATTCQFRSYSLSGSATTDSLLEGEQMWFGFCQFMLQLPPDHRIRLTIDELSTSDNCTNSGLNVVDSGSLRGKDFCNVSHPFSWTSDTNEVILGLVAYQDQIPQFSIRWLGIKRSPVPECAEVYDKPLGLWTIDSTNFAALADNQHCQILFTVEPHQRILLSLLDSVFTQDTGCDQNYIELEDSTTQRLDRYCGTEAPFSWAADSNEVLVMLIRSADFAFTKWLVNFTVIDRPPSTQQECSKILIGTSGIFESVNYPFGYHSNQECHTLIHTHPHNTITMVFTDFRLEPSVDGDCLHDYVEIYDITTYRHERVCGYLFPFSWTSDTNEVLVNFVSDTYFETPGFAATYTVTPKLESRKDCNILLYSDTGLIETPSQKTQEELAQDSSLTCQFTIHTAAVKQILLTFEELELEADVQCTLDTIEVTDKTTGRTNYYCESRLPFEWTSDHNEVTITFSTDDINRKSAHFAISYRAFDGPVRSVCDITLSDTQGGIESPSYPELYGNNLNCTITIVAGEGQLIEVDMASFELEYSVDCSYDFLELNTVGYGDTVRYCGSHSPFVWESTGNVATILLHSDHVITKPGFQGTYKLIDKVEMAMVCDKSLTAPTGSFSTPGYPGHYPNNRDCRYLITASEGLAVEITFVDFELEYHTECDYDFVKITDELTGTKDLYCGSRGVFTWESYGNQVLVDFHTDASAVFRGFRATYAFVEAPEKIEVVEEESGSVPECNQVLTSNIGFFSSPNFPLPYPNNEYCKTSIETELGTRVKVTFPFLDIEEHLGCVRDSVQVVDRETGRKSEPLCGELQRSYVWESDSNRVVIIFKSDTMVTRNGYYGTFEAIEPELLP